MKRFFALFSTVILLVSCINNDIPYPVIKGEVLEFAVKGQIDCSIDASTRTIYVTLSDAVNIRKVEILKFKITEDATSDFDSSTPKNLSTDMDFTISTYQDYQWTIQTVQPVDRAVELENQVGEAIFDIATRSVLVNVATTQPLSEIRVLKMQLGPSISTISPDPLTITDFSKPQTFTVKYFDISEQWTVTVGHSNSSVQTIEAQPWARFAYLNGNIQLSTGLEASFQIRRKDQPGTWKTVEAQVSGPTISAKATDLEPTTDYIYRARLGDEYGGDVAFRTEATPSVPNMNLNQWSVSGKIDNPWGKDQQPYWITGNAGVVIVSSSNSTPTSDSHEGLAARLQTVQVPIAGLAAGNLFTGNFVTNISKPLDSPKFGQPYTGRPTKLKFWYKYQPKVIDYAKNAPQYMGQMDKCHIQIYLGNWTEPLLAMDLKGENTQGVIAFGDFSSDVEQLSYVQKTIDIKYLNTQSQPTRIIIASTSSFYGDYYTGGTGSVLYVDDFEFSFE